MCTYWSLFDETWQQRALLRADGDGALARDEGDDEASAAIAAPKRREQARHSLTCAKNCKQDILGTVEYLCYSRQKTDDFIMKMGFRKGKDYGLNLEWKCNSFPWI